MRWGGWCNRLVIDAETDFAVPVLDVAPLRMCDEAAGDIEFHGVEFDLKLRLDCHMERMALAQKVS